MNKLYVLIGLPASGKSFWSSMVVSREDVKLVSSDAIRNELYGDEGIQGDSSKVFEIAHNRIKDYLEKGESVIFDATNISRKRRKEIFTRYKRIVSEIIAVYFATSYEDCIKRNDLRERKVPESVITSMYKSLNVPDWAEGWNDIRIVNTDEFYSRWLNKSMDISDIQLKLLKEEMTEEEIYAREMFKDIFQVDQRNYHHQHSISGHSWRVYKYIRDFLSSSRAYDDTEIILWAAIFHDCGKGFCQEWKEEKQRCTYYNHDNVGAQKAIIVLSPYLNHVKCIEIANLIGNHMLYWQNQKLASERVQCPNLLELLNRADNNSK